MRLFGKNATGIISCIYCHYDDDNKVYIFT